MTVPALTLLHRPILATENARPFTSKSVLSLLLWQAHLIAIGRGTIQTHRKSPTQSRKFSTPCQMPSDKAREASLALGDQHRIEGAFSVARNLDVEQVVVGRDALAAGAVAVVRAACRLGIALLVAEVVGQFAAQRAFEDCFLSLSDF
ncbi:hypothetical protein WJ27_05510 [Burkholderia thailandensis]|nr:hypothetical protein WJ27_05510 [Burkholderia thailandensis]